MKTEFNQLKKGLTIITPRLDEGGVSRVFLNLSRELQTRGIAINFITRTADGHFITEIQEYASLTLPPQKSITSFLFLIFKTLLFSNKKNILLAGEDIICYVVFINLILQKKHKTIATIHSNVKKTIFKKENLLFYFKKKILSFFLNNSDNLIAVSQGVAQSLKNTLDIPSKTINVIYNPVISNNFDVKKHEFYIPRTFKNEKIIIYVGRLSKEKRVDLIIESYFLVSKTVRGSKLWIVGDGPEKKHLQELVLSNHQKDKIIFFGHQKNPLPFIYSADVLVLASEWEGFGNVIVEALACGTSVVAHNCPDGPSEILESGKYGYLVNKNTPDALADAITHQLTFPLLPKDELINRGRFFSSQKSADLYLSLIK